MYVALHAAIMAGEDKPMRVLIVLPAILGGAGRIGVELADGLRAHGHTADIFLSLGSGDLVEEARERGIRVYSSRGGWGVGPLKAVVLFAWAVVRLARLGRNYDILLGANDAVDHLLVTVVGRVVQKPAVGVFQITPSDHLKGLGGAKRLLMGLAVRQGSPRLNLLVTVSEAVKSDAVALAAVPRNTIVIPNGVPVARVRDLATTREPLRTGGPLVIGVGRLAPEKGFDVLIRAHGIARKQAPHTLLLLGDGEEREDLEALATSLGLTDSVHFAGFTANPYPEMRAADLICVPSRHEGSPLVVREALALGLPIVGADSLGTSGSLNGGQLGKLVPIDNPVALAEAIVDHLSDPRPLLSRAATGREEVEREHDVGTMVADYAKALLALAEEDEADANRYRGPEVTG